MNLLFSLLTFVALCAAWWEVHTLTAHLRRVERAAANLAANPKSPIALLNLQRILLDGDCK